MPRRAGPIAILGLVLTSTGCGLLLAEAGLRLLRISHPSLYVRDEVLGFAQRPGASGWFRHEGGSRVRLNRDGWRDVERAAAKPPGTWRIAVLGDSYVQALQVRRQDGFCARLEDELRACAVTQGRRVEVLNFGVASYGTAQELLVLRHRVWRYAPDLVVLAFLTGNDIQNNDRRLEGDALRPYFVLHGDSLVLDDRFRSEPAFRPRRDWRTRLRDAAVRRSYLAQSIWSARRRARGGPGYAGPDLSQHIYTPPADRTWDEAWRLTERLVVEFRDECARQGAGFLLVTLSNPEQVHADRAVRAALARRLGVDDLFYAERRLEDLAEREGFAIVTLAPALQQHAQTSGDCLHGFDNAVPCGGHWNRAGHRLAAHIVAEALCRRASAAAARSSLGRWE